MEPLHDGGHQPEAEPVEHEEEEPQGEKGDGEREDQEHRAHHRIHQAEQHAGRHRGQHAVEPDARNDRGGQDDGQDIDENTHEEAHALDPRAGVYYTGKPIEGGPMRRLAILIAITLVTAPGAFAQGGAGTMNFTINPVMSKGPANAPVTIVEVSDYQCPHCKRAQPVLSQVMAKFPDKVRLVFKDFPLGFHERALPAAEAARCAGEHGRYWEYHDLLFAAQPAFSTANLLEYGARLGLPAEPFAACVESNRHRDAVLADFSEARAAGVRGTPTFFVNGRQIVGAQRIQVFQKAVQDALAGARRSSLTSRSRGGGLN